MSPLAPSQPDQTTSTTAAFKDEAEVVLRDLRPALAEILERLEPPVVRATHLRRALNLSYQLSWSIFNAAGARDARTLVTHLPRRRGMDAFFAAVEQHQSVPNETIERAKTAFARFEESVMRHAGRRDTFETMFASVEGASGQSEPDDSADFKQKRAAFRANSLLWGREVRVNCAAFIIHPSQTEGLLDTAFIRGMIGLRRTRSGALKHTFSRRWFPLKPDGTPQAGTVELLDPREVGPDAIGLLHDFCSNPPPQFVLRENNTHHRTHEIVGDSIGAASDVTFFLGDARRPDPSVSYEMISSWRGFDVAAEMFIGDTIVHKSIEKPTLPRALVYPLVSIGSPDLPNTEPMPLSETMEYLGDGIDSARTPHIPRYAEMLAWAMKNLGWNADDFRVYRCRVEYPLLHTRVRMMLTPEHSES